MKVTFENGTSISKDQLVSELQECGISLISTQRLVRWNHNSLGIVFDTIDDYRKHCGHEETIGELEVFQPKYALANYNLSV